MAKVNTNIKSTLTPREEKLFAILRDVAQKYAPGTQPRVAGGWVRDHLLGVPSHDIDIMIDSMSGEDFAKLVTNYIGANDPHVIRENPDASKHVETAKAYIPIDGEEMEIDFARARKEVYHEDSRVPDIRPATAAEDAERRDLTINSLFYNIVTGELEDFTGKGIKDLISDTIRTPLDPKKTFLDDPLRIFRTIRFASKYAGKIDSETYAAMQDPALRDAINTKISKERIQEEIIKMLKGPNPVYGIELLKDTGLFDDIIQQATKGTKFEGKMAPLDMEQNNVHHNLSLWGHTLQTLKNVVATYSESDEEVRVLMVLAALMHDLGKTYQDIWTPSKSQPGSTSYIGHELESAQLTELIMRYLKMESKLMKGVMGLVESHMRPHKFTEGGAKARAMRKFIRQMGEKSLNWLDVFNLAMSDAKAKDVIEDAQITENYMQLRSELEDAVRTLTMEGQTNPDVKPVLNGNEIMSTLNIKAGPWMSVITEFVKELRDMNPNISKEEAKEALINEFGNVDVTQISNSTRQAQQNFQVVEVNPDGTVIIQIDEDQQAPKEKQMGSCCPMHLLEQKKEDILEALRKKEFYKALGYLKELVKDYGNDEKVTRMVAYCILAMLCKDKKYADIEVLDHLFDKAEKNFYDYVLRAIVLGILITIENGTDEKDIKNIANDVCKLCPDVVRTVLRMLPKDIHNQHLKEYVEGLV